MRNVRVKVTLEDTLKESGLTRNKIAVEGKIRPATISELCNGKSKALSFETIEKIIGALDELDTSREHTILDVITVERG